MKTRDTRYNAGSFPKSPVKAAAVPISIFIAGSFPKSPVKAAAASISIFVGLYLAAGGIVRVLHWEAAAAVVRNGSVAHTVASSAASSPAGSVEPLNRDFAGPVIEPHR